MTMQSKNYQLYVFDWDGTVMDTTGLIARGMQQACVTLGYPQPDLDACRETIGLPFAESFARVAPGFRYEQLDEFLTAYRNWYLQREAQVDVMAGLEDLFDRMTKNGLRLAVATGKSRAGLIRVFERTGLEKYFEATVTADGLVSAGELSILHGSIVFGGDADSGSAVLTSTDGEDIILTGTLKTGVQVTIVQGSDAVNVPVRFDNFSDNGGTVGFQAFGSEEVSEDIPDWIDAIYAGNVTLGGLTITNDAVYTYNGTSQYPSAMLASVSGMASQGFINKTLVIDNNCLCPCDRILLLACSIVS